MMNEKKSILRKKFRKIRNEISDEKHVSASKKIAKLGFQLIQDIAKKSDVISGYYPFGNEISSLMLMQKLYENGFTCTLPFIDGVELSFYKWDLLEKSLVSSATHSKIKEPLNRDMELTPNILLVPLIAFDNKKHRLGQGGGFYDRTIDRLENSTITIGLAYEKQFSEEELPILVHDQRLNYIITEEKII